jgi:hypothetical protein
LFFVLSMGGADMSGIPEMKCPGCGTEMNYEGGPSDGNIFIMICPKCHYQQEYYAEDGAEKRLVSTPIILFN